MSMTDGPTITREEFVARFKAEMVRLAPFDRFVEEDGTEGETVADYAEGVAPSYWEDGNLRPDGPEECAWSDMSYWGE